MASRRISVLTLSAVATVLMSPGMAVAAQAPGLERAQVIRAEAGRPLTAASKAAPADIVSGYLRNRGRSAAVLSSLRITRSSLGAHGVTHLRMEQVVDGLNVYGAYAKAAVNGRGELVHVVDRLVEVAAAPTPSRVDAAAALNAAMARVHPGQSIAFRAAGAQGNTATFDGGAFFHTAATVTAVAVPMGNGALDRGWLVQTWTEKSNQLHHTLVGGDGRVLDVENRTASDRYNVFVEDPSKGPQTVVNGPSPGNALSPAGWLGTGAQTTNSISGNNVNAYLDTDNNNRSDRSGTAVATGDFLTAADLAASPSTTGNKAVSVQNLFYLNNIIHDVLYSHGFNEAAGNFQVDNFGKGGASGDPVLAEAQDGGGTDNANFATPTDGKKPRMQMYLWTGAGPTHEVRVNSPVSTSYAAKGAEFGPALTSTGVTGNVVTTTPADGCTTISTVLTGKVAVIDRGACNFSIKALNAQTAGADAVIIANNQGGTDIFTMGGTERRVRIPAAMISQNDGASLKGLASPNATVRKLAVQPLQLDGSVDSDIVFHEYGHGLTWRMIGGMSGPLAGAVGEGTSDAISMLVNGDDVIGEYSFSNPVGIRRYRYEGYPLTYANVDGAEVHNDGEIYAAIIWKMMGLFGESRRAELFRYVVDGMNYTPATPAYEQMRDGILASVSAGSTPADCMLVWQAFAQFGVGVGASGVVSGSGAVTITPSYTPPATCN
ncbi:MAG: M36 family metallopeptidase [Ramlibacter sp.]|nr:M36 family metallopeptidase [Ramlibacter sp.]